MKKYLQLFVATMTLSMLCGCNQEQMNVKKEELTFEYGEVIPTDVQNYLDNSDDYLKETVMKGIPQNEKGKEYPSVGEYFLTLFHDKESMKVKVNIKDTTAPVFTDKNTAVTVENGKKIEKNIFKATDLSPVEIKVEDSQVNYDKAGNYTVKVKATDKYNNTAQKEVKLTVKEKKVEKTSEKTSTTSKKTTSNKSTQKSNTSNKTGNSSSNSSNKNNGTSNSGTSNGSGTGNTGTSSGTSGSSSSSSNDLWVANLKVAKSYSKIMIASAPSSSSRQGTFTYYQKVNGKWKEVMETTAYFGSSGVGQGHENSRRSPVGQYTFTKLMGLSSNPGTQLPYHRIDNNDYWCGETLYNQFVDEDVTEHNCSKKNDERLADYTLPYRYVAAFNYNPGNVKGKGFAYFLHSKGNTNYTGGCVAISNSKMKTIMQAIDSNTVFIIDLEKNITKY
ncbi:MAG: L,D-transpeptidase family protein [Massilimicrobiota timonensis]